METIITYQRGDHVLALYNGNNELKFTGTITGFRRDGQTTFAIIKPEQLLTLKLVGIGSMVSIDVKLIVSKVYLNQKERKNYEKQ